MFMPELAGRVGFGGVHALDEWASSPIYVSIGVLLPCWGNACANEGRHLPAENAILLSG